MGYDAQLARQLYKQDDLQAQETRSHWPSFCFFLSEFVSTYVNAWLQVS